MKSHLYGLSKKGAESSVTRELCNEFKNVCLKFTLGLQILKRFLPSGSNVSSFIIAFCIERRKSLQI